MKLKNFHIEDNCAVVIDSKYFDLHNDFKLEGFRYDIANTEFELSWKSISQPQGILIIFQEVSYLKIRERDPDKSEQEDNCLDFLGFLHPEDSAEMDGYVDSRDVKDNYQMIFNFEGGMAIKVFAKQAELKLISSSAKIN